jgi:hypothetical protein
MLNASLESEVNSVCSGFRLGSVYKPINPNVFKQALIAQGKIPTDRKIYLF